MVKTSVIFAVIIGLIALFFARDFFIHDRYNREETEEADETIANITSVESPKSGEYSCPSDYTFDANFSYAFETVSMTSGSNTTFSLNRTDSKMYRYGEQGQDTSHSFIYNFNFDGRTVGLLSTVDLTFIELCTRIERRSRR